VPPLPAQDSSAACEWLAAIPITFHVEGGPEFRAAIADVATRLSAALGTPPDS
jgi:hypothetical protein